MVLPKDLKDVEEATEFPKLTPGGYICRIVNVVDVYEKQYLKVEFEIAEGEHKGYYGRLFDAKQFWGGVIYKSYREDLLPYFKGFITAVEKSNPGYVFDHENERFLKGKAIGIILGEEEYVANDGTVKTRITAVGQRSVDSIRKGDFKVPDKKLLKVQNPSQQVVPPLDDNAPPPF